MKLKHKVFDKVSVYCEGKLYNFVDGEIEVDETIAKELLKNPAIEEIKVEETTNVEEDVEEEKQENVDKHDEKKKGSKK